MRGLLLTLTVLALLVVVPGTASARIVEVLIDKIEPFAGGKEFGSAGAFQRVKGRAKGELDPKDKRNAVIKGLDQAPLNARGMVEYEVDFFILRPADAAKGNGRLIYDVTNRGRKFLNIWLMDAAITQNDANDPKSPADAGNGLFLRTGFTIVWSGWDPDAPTANNGLAIRVPVATDNGKPIVATIREEFVSATRGPAVEAFRLSYESDTAEPSKATLTARRREGAEKVTIAADKWSFADHRTIRLLPAGTKPEPGSLYELHYPARNPKVVGIGFAATRDLISFLRTVTDGALAGHNYKHALAVGISQSGRYLRDHIAFGFNQDENGRRVFDGVLAHISGVGRVFMNELFAQPWRTNTEHEDHLFPENAFPFSAASTRDPVSRKTGRLLRGDGFDPLLIETNTSTEYWQKGASLLHTDPTGRNDLALPPSVRTYLIAGTQHGGRSGLKADLGNCVNPRNPHSAAPALRALMIALDEWVAKGKAPPPSRVPSLAGKSLIATETLKFPAIPRAAVARSANRIAVIADWKKASVVTDTAYRPLVSAIDADGNETAGVRLPDIAVPIATFTGWNLYQAPFPEGALCDRDGSYLAFARTKAEREQIGDPRLSLAERYGSKEAYLAKVKAAADRLVKDRLLLPDDAAQLIEKARAVQF